jgi:hypothetical protein
VGVEVIVTVGLEVGVVVAWDTVTVAPATGRPWTVTACPLVPLIAVTLKA